MTELQRAGRGCGRRPQACMVEQLLRAAGLDPGRTRVCDPTFGRGTWWLRFRPRLLAAADPVVRRWEAVPDVFVQARLPGSLLRLRVLAGGCTVAACDPPWGSPGNRRPEYRHAEAAPPDMLLRLCASEALDAGAEVLLLHWRGMAEPPGWALLHGVYVEAWSRRTRPAATWWGVYAPRR